jgi:AAA-like domain/CHAT domain
MNSRHSPIKILFLAANPKDTERLRLDEEVREIEQSLRLSRDREQFKFTQKWAPRTQDIQKILLEDETPEIVHFSGHGEGDRGLTFEDVNGQSQSVGTEALVGLFKLFKQEIQCVVLNACYSDVQAKAIAQHIPYVIGMSEAIGDTAARKFSTGFYDALAAGRSIETAYDFGCNSIQLEISGREHLTPVLKKQTDWQEETPADPFYIERSPVEAECFEEITQPGALIVIKASHRMGKSALMSKILSYARTKQYRTITLSFREADDEILQSNERFLKWFCHSVCSELNLENDVDQVWRSHLSHRQNCTNYFEKQVLPAIDQPLVIGLDDIDKLFGHLKIAIEFFSILRVWYETSRNPSVWKKMRLVLAVSREVDNIPLPPNNSPFNVGLKAELVEFNFSQVQELVRRHGLQWSEAQINQLMSIVDGHPYLLRIALRPLASGQLTLDRFCQTSPTEEGIYHDHLHHHWRALEQDPDLQMALKQMVAADDPVVLDIKDQSKLCNVGLGELQGNGVIPLCNLYRIYFRNRLKIS